MRQLQRRVSREVAEAFDEDASALKANCRCWTAFPTDTRDRAGLPSTAFAAEVWLVSSVTHEAAFRGRPGGRSDLGLPFHQTCPATTPVGRFDFGRLFTHSSHRLSDGQEFRHSETAWA